MALMRVQLSRDHHAQSQVQDPNGISWLTTALQERKSAVREGAALWSAALQAGRPYLLDNEPFTVRLC